MRLNLAMFCRTRRLRGAAGLFAVHRVYAYVRRRTSCSTAMWSSRFRAVRRLRDFVLLLAAWGLLRHPAMYAVALPVGTLAGYELAVPDAGHSRLAATALELASRAADHAAVLSNSGWIACFNAASAF